VRADRLIAALLFLQARGKVTARELADELEVSERTARRDLEALAISGVPLYSTSGRGGGWQLIGGARTDLTGLTSDEARSLFLALAQRSDAGSAMPLPLASAVRKLTSALPESFRADATAASDAIKVDPAGWGQIGGRPTPPFVSDLTAAVVAAQQVRIDYQRPGHKVDSRIVHPLGLVTKRSVWYLVAPDFDLDDEWDRIVSEVEAQRAGVSVAARVAPESIGPLRWQFGARVDVGSVDDDGWTNVVLTENGPTALAAQLAGYGGNIELIDPPGPVTAEMARIASELSGLYGAIGSSRSESA